MTNSKRFAQHFHGLVILIVFSWLSLLLGGCDNLIAGTTTTTISQVFPELANLQASATNLTIRNDYGDMISNRTMEYTLTRQSSNFGGNGVFGETRAYKQPDKYKTVDITIPLSVVQDFLQNLTQIPITAGKYKPVMEATDSFPDIGYNVETPVGTLSFYTYSGNEDLYHPSVGYNLPWGFSFANREFVIDSPLAAQALSTLKPYLHEEVLQQLLDLDKTSETPTATSKPTGLTSGTLSQIFPETANLATTANAIDFYQSNIDISQNNPVVGYEASYNLLHLQGDFRGSGEFRFYNVPISQSYTFRDTVIPSQVAQDFLQTVTQIPMQAGKYAPYIDRKNDPSEIGYTITFNYERLNFHTSSQNKLNASATEQNNLPWELDFNGQSFTITSPLVSQALAKLKPYLHEEIIKQVVSANSAKPAPASPVQTSVPAKTP